MRCSLIGAVLAFGGFSQAAFNQGALRAFNRVQQFEQRWEAVPAEQPAFQARAAPRFLTNKTEKFAVDGTAIPEVKFDIGESYAGLLPISQAANETRELYFWFFPSTNATVDDEVVIW
jgi:carboxypeptidase D